MYFPAPSPPLHGKTGSTKCCLQRQTGPGDAVVVVVVLVVVVVVVLVLLLLLLLLVVV